MVSGKKSYGCSNRKEGGCEFKIWKKSFNKTIWEKQALLLLTKRETGVLSFTSKEKGTKFSAKLILDENNQVKLKFANESKGK
ncbi:topoisomerase C-terminal repeat-containing protein [Cytobacillus oceanisediminis]|uniref:topoisomerase C-terminal repeat-containing protein n=1 Tax=Cytobacillus oceanisediminis TaxID=665099 RepID=UPI0034A0B43D